MQMLRCGPSWDAANSNTSWLDTQVKALPKIKAWEDGDATPVARSWALAEFTLAATGTFLTHDLTQPAAAASIMRRCWQPMPKVPGRYCPAPASAASCADQAERIPRTLATFNAWDAQAKTAGQGEGGFFHRMPCLQPVDNRDQRSGGKL